MGPNSFCVDNAREGVVSIISVAGELDIATAPVLQTALDGVWADGARHVLVDLTNTGFLESTGLRTLLMASQRASGTASLSIVCPNAGLRRVFELTGIDDLLVMHDDRTTALRWHQRRAQTASVSCL